MSTIYLFCEEFLRNGFAVSLTPLSLAMTVETLLNKHLRMCMCRTVCVSESHAGVCLQVLFVLACLFVKMSLITDSKHL